MKKNYLKTILILLVAFGLKANAQCSGCTISVTGLDAANHIVSSGQTMCVTSTGTLTGLITVSAGGTLCNQGKIGSTNVWIAGGTFINHGTIDTYSITISAAGTFTNYATALIDSLWITNANTTYINNGTQTGTAFAITNHGSSTNNGSITVYDHGDSLGTFINNGTITVTHDCASSYSSTCINNGNITVSNDFATSYNSTFTNNNYMSVGRDYFNSANANFTTKCMISVGRDWYNAANLYGPAVSCGGFNVAGNTYNTGVLGSGSTHIDICDAGHPALGIDGPGGTINGTTTYCACSNSCVLVTTGVKEMQAKSNVSILNVFPNPTSSLLNIKLNNKEYETLTLQVRDMMGRVVLSQLYQASIGENITELNVSTLAQGTYILNITDSHKLQSKSLFSVAK